MHVYILVSVWRRLGWPPPTCTNSPSCSMPCSQPAACLAGWSRGADLGGPPSNAMLLSVQPPASNVRPAGAILRLATPQLPCPSLPLPPLRLLALQPADIHLCSAGVCDYRPFTARPKCHASTIGPLMANKSRHLSAALNLLCTNAEHKNCNLMSSDAISYWTRIQKQSMHALYKVRLFIR